MAEDPIATKLSAARTRLILDKPFLGALVLRLPMVEADPNWCRTTATDARSLYYNRAFIEVLSLDHVQFMLAHEALHCALAHFARRQHRVKHRWDVACDHAINPMLVEDGLRPPPGTLLLDEFKGMTAEEIYPYIKDDTDEETLDQHAYDDAEGGQRGNQNNPNPPPPQSERGSSASADETNSAGKSPQAAPESGAPQPPPLSSTERDTLAVQWQQRLAGAAQQALQAGKLGGALARLVDHLLQPQLPWRMLLARYLTSIARDDYSYMRPSRREGNAILPSLRSHHLELTVVLDTSGSVTEAELNEFLAEVNAIRVRCRRTSRCTAATRNCRRRSLAGRGLGGTPTATHIPGRWRHQLSATVYLGRASGPPTRSARVLHRCPGRVSGTRAVVSGVVAGEGPIAGAVGPARPAELMKASLHKHNCFKKAMTDA